VIGVWATISLRRDGTLVQMDPGRPSFDEPFINPDDAKDEYNARSPIDDVKNYVKPWSGLLQSHGYSAAEAAELACSVLPDILYYDRAQPATYPNGRVPTDDCFSARTAFLTHGQVTSDGLRPHDDLLAEFPVPRRPESLD
jgi:hypothetical protein